MTPEQFLKGSVARRETARNILDARSFDRRSAYQNDRNAYDYVDLLSGLEFLFSYVRQLESQIVLDIGAGTTAGVFQLSHSKLGSGIDFEATILARPRAVFLPQSKIHITSAEQLRGIPGGSIGAVLGVGSLCYVKHTELAMQRIDKVLVPGGVIKTFFPPLSNKYPINNEDGLVTSLKKAGYDFQCRKEGGCALILAVKPGGPISITAEELMDGDRYWVGEQKRIVKEEELDKYCFNYTQQFDV